MKQYLDLMNKVLAEGTLKPTVPALARCRFSAIRCVSTCRKVSRW